MQQTGAACTVKVNFTMQALLATLAQNYNVVTFYADGSTTVLGTLTVPIYSTAMVFDSNGNLYVASGNVSLNTPSVTKYAPPYTSTPTTITTGVSNPNALAIDKSNNLFVSDDYNPAATVTEYAPGTTAPSRTISTGVPSPDSLCTDPSGNLFVSNGGSYATLVEYAPGATTPSHTVGPFTFSDYIVCDGLGNVFDGRYEYDDYGYYIIEVDKYGPGLTSLGSLNDITGPGDMAVDSANNVYVGNGGSDTTNILRFPPGSINPNLTITAGLAYPQVLAVDPFLNVYAYDYSGKIYEYLAGSTSINLTISPADYPISAMAFSP